jgi:hypothetical protein
MSQVRSLIVVVVLVIAAMALGCSQPSQSPAGQTAGAPAAQGPETAASTPPAGGQSAVGQPSAAPAAPAAAQRPAGTRESAAAPTTGRPTAPAGAAEQPAAPPEPPKPRVYTLPAGAVLEVETASTLSTKTDKTGDPFAATLVEPIADGDWIIAPKGATVSGVVVSSDAGGRVKGVATLTIGLKKLTLANKETVALATSTYQMDANTTKKMDATKIAVGAGVGAVVGGITGGKKGAGVGAATGAGAGAAVVLATRGDPAVIPAGSIVTFKLTEPITVTKTQ